MRNIIAVIPTQERLVFHRVQLLCQQFGKLFGYFQLPFYVLGVHWCMIFQQSPKFQDGHSQVGRRGLTRGSTTIRAAMRARLRGWLIRPFKAYLISRNRPLLTS